MFGFGQRHTKLAAVEAATGLALLVWSWDHDKIFTESGSQTPTDPDVRREIFLLQVLMALKAAEQGLQRQPKAFPAVLGSFSLVHAALVQFLAPDDRAAEIAELMPNLARNLEEISQRDPPAYRRMETVWRFAPQELAGEASFEAYESTMQASGDLLATIQSMRSFAPTARDPILQLVLGIILRMTYDVALDVSRQWRITDA